MGEIKVTGGVNPYIPAATTSTTTVETKDTENSTSTKENTTGVVYEKTNASEETDKKNANKIYNKDAIVSKLKVDQEARITSMQNLVSKLLGKQKNLFDIASMSDDELSSLNLSGTFKEAAALASPEDIYKAQQDISEDGYWGVNQTSDRLVSMAIALSGGDTDKADEMMEAIQKGFDIATKAWGEDLPQICKDTLDATMSKMTDWKNGVTTAEDYSKYLS